MYESELYFSFFVTTTDYVIGYEHNTDMRMMLTDQTTNELMGNSNELN